MARSHPLARAQDVASTVLEAQMGMVNRGAYIGFASQFPGHAAPRTTIAATSVATADALDPSGLGAIFLERNHSPVHHLSAHHRYLHIYHPVFIKILCHGVEHITLPIWAFLESRLRSNNR